MKLVKLSIGNGRHIWVNPDRVRSIWAGVGVYEGKTMVDSGDADGPTCIHGTPDEVAAALTGEAPASGLLKGLDVETFAADVVAALKRAAAGLDEAPADAPAVAEREVLPLWEQDKYGDWSRGPWVSYLALVGRCGDRYRGHAGDRESSLCLTVEAAMAAADMLAREAGYPLPWDSMVPDPSLVAVLGGKLFKLWPMPSGHAGIGAVSDTFAEDNAAGKLAARIPADLTAQGRLDALVRLLRAHGAIVTEAA